MFKFCRPALCVCVCVRTRLDHAFACMLLNVFFGLFAFISSISTHIHMYVCDNFAIIPV